MINNQNKYLSFAQILIDDFSAEIIEKYYNQGYVMTRIGRGTMDQTRSLRIKLAEFKFSSENRRILRKNENLSFESISLPIAVENYNWEIHKIGKDFYTNKFGDKTFSANKIKELLTSNHNFNKLLVYKRENETIGYCIVLETERIFHYCYPFYRLDVNTNNLGMGMMLRAIEYALNTGKEFIYLGSLQRESDKYKLQFEGVEVWDENPQKWMPQTTVR
jgi:arginyl-tRNA--protein-N-Asp/Glu arginylyltransferase